MVLINKEQLNLNHTMLSRKQLLTPSTQICSSDNITPAYNYLDIFSFHSLNIFKKTKELAQLLQVRRLHRQIPEEQREKLNDLSALFPQEGRRMRVLRNPGCYIIQTKSNRVLKKQQRKLDSPRCIKPSLKENDLLKKKIFLKIIIKKTFAKFE